MKSIIIFALTFLCSVSVTFAQKDSTTTKNKPTKTEGEIKVDESIAKIKKEIENIKKNIDSAKLREISRQLGKSAEEIGSQLEDIADEIEEKADEVEKRVERKAEKTEQKIEDAMEDAEKGTNKKQAKASRRTKMYVEFGLGLAGLQNSGTLPAIAPELKVWGSNYWDLGLKFKTRLGGANSPAAISYGLTYMLNSFETTNNVKVQLVDGVQSFVKLDNAKNTELNIGYVTIPVALEFKIGKKGKLGVGGYGGYRVRTIQNIDLRSDNEDISERRKGNYGLNNLMYGASVKLGVGGLVLNGRYNLSSLFKNETNYTYNIYNLGLSFGF